MFAPSHPYSRSRPPLHQQPDPSSSNNRSHKKLHVDTLVESPIELTDEYLEVIYRQTPQLSPLSHTHVDSPNLLACSFPGRTFQCKYKAAHLSSCWSKTCHTVPLNERGRSRAMMAGSDRGGLTMASTRISLSPPPPPPPLSLPPLSLSRALSRSLAPSPPRSLARRSSPSAPTAYPNSQARGALGPTVTRMGETWRRAGRKSAVYECAHAQIHTAEPGGSEPSQQALMHAWWERS